MSADVEVGNFEPQIEVDIVLLTPLEGFVVLAAGARDDEEFVVEAAEGVAVTGVLHVVHPQAVENVSLVVHDLEALFQTRWLSLDVSSANQEYLVAWRLNVREIVLETHLHVHLSPEYLLSNQVVLVDVFRVALEDVDGGQVAAVGHHGRRVSCLGHCRGHGLSLSSHRGVHHCWPLVDVSQAINGVVGVPVKSALASLLVAQIVIEKPVSLALVAVDAEDVFEQVGHDAVRLLHLHLLVALTAGEVLARFVIIGHVALQAGELDEAVIAGARPALGALEDVGNHEHADGALEVLRLDAQPRVRVKVFLLHTVLLVITTAAGSSFNHFSSLLFLSY